MDRTQDLARRLRITYLLALALIAALATAGHVRLDATMAELERDAESVNLAGRQRLLSERLARLGPELAARAGAFGYGPTLARARGVADELLAVHRRMRPELEALGRARFVDGHVEPLLEAFERLASRPRRRTALESLEVAQADFVERQEAIVHALEASSEARASRSRRTLTALLCAILGTLALEALLVFEPAVRTLRRLFEDKRRVYARLHDQLERDELTGLSNRRRLMRDLAEADGTDPPARRALAFLDFDGFKAINDSLGHDAGDALLRSMAERLKGLCDVDGEIRAYRLSGDEFVLLLEAPDAARRIEPLVVRALERLREPHVLHRRRVASNASAGISLCATPDCRGVRMLYEADAAMRASKLDGKGRYTVYDETMLRTDERRLGIERDLERAIEAEEIGLRYQLVRGLSDGEPIGVEALLHWEHPTLGKIDNGELVDAACASRTMGRLGAHALSTACAELVRARRRGAPALDLYVNVQPSEVRSPGYVERVRDTLALTGLPAPALHLECTGGMPRRGMLETVSAMRELAGLGVVTGFDDVDRQSFSLRAFTDSPVRFVKLAPLEDDGVLDAFARFCRALDLRVMAKGVETDRALARVRRAGFDAVQGHAIGRPGPLDRVLEGVEAKGEAPRTGTDG